MFQAMIFGILAILLTPVGSFVPGMWSSEQSDFQQLWVRVGFWNSTFGVGVRVSKKSKSEFCGPFHVHGTFAIRVWIAQLFTISCDMVTKECMLIRLKCLLNARFMRQWNSSKIMNRLSKQVLLFVDSFFAWKHPCFKR